MSLFQRQAKEILAMEQAQREAILATVVQARQEIRNLMANLPQGSSLINHYSQLQVQLDEILNHVNPQLSSVPFVAGQMYGTELVNESSGASFVVPSLNLPAIAAINLKAVEKISEVNQLLKTTIHEQLRISLALGEGIQEATERLSVLGFRRSLWRYELIARTVTNEMANAGANSTYSTLAKEEPRLRLKKQWSSVLDKRTSPPCQALDGEIQPPDEPFSLGYMYPPALPNCRSRVVPVTAKYDPTPKLSEIATTFTGDKATDSALKEGKRRLESVPGIDKGWTDYHRVKVLEQRKVASPAMLELEAKFARGEISGEDFAQGKAKLAQQWLKSPEGQSYTKLLESLDQYPEAILKAGNFTPEKQVKAQLQLNSLQYGIPDTDYPKGYSKTKITQQQLEEARTLLPRAIAIQPQSSAKLAPTTVLPADVSSWLGGSNPVAILLQTDSDDPNFFKQSIIHELTHGIENADPEALRQAVTLRKALQTGIEEKFYGNQRIYLAVGEGIARRPYGGVLYPNNWSTEVYTVASEALTDGMLFFQSIETAPNPLYLLLSKLDIFL